MKSYLKSWGKGTVSNSGKGWMRFKEPMQLSVQENSYSTLFISASLEFEQLKKIKSNKHPGSVFYKILVDGDTVSEYHLSAPRFNHKKLDVNLSAKTEITEGSHTIEVYYRPAQNSSTDLLRNQICSVLNVLSVPKPD